LERTGDGWLASSVKAQFDVEGPFAAGWYRFDVKLQSADRFTIRKRADLVFESDDGRTLAQDSLAWNRELNDGCLVHLPKPAARLTWTLTQSEGHFSLDHFELTRLSKSRVAIAAMREKFRLLTAFDCLRPALRRGVGMLLRGEVRTIGRKLAQGLLDSRAMRLGGYRAAPSAGGWMRSLSVKADEADGAWWRRHALPADEAEQIRAKCDAMTAAAPIAVLLPIDPRKLDAGRLAALSVRRQLYPHWELLLVCAGPSSCQAQMATWLGNDPRVRVVVVDADAGLAVAVARALGQATCEQVVVLPADVELTEDALFRFVGERPVGEVWKTLLAARMGNDRIWMTSLRHIPDTIPDVFTPSAIEAWLTSDVPVADRVLLDDVIAFPLEDRSLAGAARIGTPTETTTQRLFIGADVQGLSGWDHLAYAVLVGLPSCGVEFVQHPRCLIRPDLLPPRFVPSIGMRTKRDKQLVIGPPFLIERFEPDENTAVFTMWETDHLRSADVQVLNRTGLVIVPSQWGADCFRRSGVTVPIAVVPLGYDPLVYYADGSFPTVCTFGTAGALTAGGFRKNATHVIDLFRRAFPTDPDVRLRVKITPTSPAIDTFDDPRIDVIRTTLSNTELAKWYRSLTVFINGSMGEGFGLHLIEAMACGRPLISSAYSGPTAYFDDSVGYVVGHRAVPVQSEIYSGHWAEPNDDEIIRQMRRVYADAEEARRLGDRSATRASGFTWKAAGRKLAATLYINSTTQ